MTTQYGARQADDLDDGPVTRDDRVLISGAGPTGLFLAGELATLGVPCRIVERRLTRTTESRALGLHARTLETLDMRGVLGEFLERGHPVPRVRLSLGPSMLRLSELDTRFGRLHIIPQGVTEDILERRAGALGVEVERGVQVRRVRPGDHGVVVSTVQDGRVTLTEHPWVVGCDGSRSPVRESVGIPFRGKTYPYTILVADVTLRRPPVDDLMIHVGRAGLVVSTAFGDGWYRMGVIDRSKAWSDDPVELPEVAETLARIFGRDLGPGNPLWTSRFRIQERQADTYRSGRVLLAGDAAHVHSPLGGQGLNLGIQDAAALGWRLAGVIAGGDPVVLDEYATERRRVSQGVIRVTDIATRAMTSPHRPVRLLRRAMVPFMLSKPPAHRRAVGYLSGIRTRYPAPAGMPAEVGRRVGDRVVRVPAGGEVRLPELLHEARPVLLTHPGVDVPPGLDPGGRLRPVVGRLSGTDRLARVRMLLVRPDGTCGWLGDRPDHHLERLLATWSGPAPGRPVPEPAVGGPGADTRRTAGRHN